MDIKASISATREGFEESFCSGDFYNKQTQDCGHLPKKKDTAYGYEALLNKHDRAIVDSYNLVQTDTEIYITEKVNNILFVKNQNPVK